MITYTREVLSFHHAKVNYSAFVDLSHSTQSRWLGRVRAIQMRFVVDTAAR